MDGEKKLSELKHLSLKEKLQYCWDYYKWAFILIIVLLFIGIGILGVIQNAQKTTVLNIAIPSTLSSETGESLPVIFSEYMGGLSDKEEIGIISFPASFAEEGLLDAQASLQLTTVIAAQGLDILIGDEICYESYSEQEAFYKIEEVLDSEIIMQYEELISPRGDALMLTSSGVSAKWGIPDGEVYYFAILANTPRLDMAEQLMRAVMEGNQ